MSCRSLDAVKIMLRPYRTYERSVNVRTSGTCTLSAILHAPGCPRTHQATLLTGDRAGIPSEMARSCARWHGRDVRGVPSTSLTCHLGFPQATLPPAPPPENRRTIPTQEAEPHMARLKHSCLHSCLLSWRMAQITIRTSDELVQRVKRCAAETGRSMNDYVTATLDVATDPDRAGSAAERLCERLRAAGLLSVPAPLSGARSSAEEVAEAGRRAAAGRPLSDFVSDSR